MKRIFAVVLVMALCLTLTPGVFASGEAGEVTGTEETTVLDDAPDAAASGEIEEAPPEEVVEPEMVTETEAITGAENTEDIEEEPVFDGSNQIVMTADEFIGYLKKALNRNTIYDNTKGRNLGYYNGTTISWDCWNLGKSIIWSKGTIVDNYTVGTQAKQNSSCGLGDWTGYRIVCQASTPSTDFSSITPGEWLYMSSSPHVGYYIGGGLVIECTKGWGVNCVTLSQIDASGTRSRNGVKNGKWTQHAKVPWIDYSSSVSDNPGGGTGGGTVNPVAPTISGVSVSGTSVTVSWGAVANATYYDVYLVQSPWGWDDIKYSGSTTSASYTFSNVSEGSYCAFVIARPNKDWIQSGWVSFAVPIVYLRTYNAKEVSSTSARLSGGMDFNYSKTIEYGIEIGTDSLYFSKRLSTVETTDGDFYSRPLFEQVFDNLAPGTTYYYRSYAIVDNDSCFYGVTKSFTTAITVPDTPVIQVNSDTFYEGNTVTISWAPVANAATYNYYVAQYPAGYAYTDSTRSGSTASTSVSFNDLESGRYYVFIHAIGASGGVSNQSNWLSFCVRDPIYTPVAAEIYNGHTYFLYDAEETWSFTEELCISLGGHMVTVTDAAENAFITEFIKKGSKDAYWLGGNNADTVEFDSASYPYKWITGETFSYTNWHSGEPSNSSSLYSKEHFIEIRKSYDYQWNDAANANKVNKGFILEIDSVSCADMGTDFYATIVFAQGNINIENTGSNVCIASENNANDPKQIWHFEKDSNGSYKITSLYDGKCLNAAGSGTMNQTNVDVSYSNDSSAQRWVIQGDSSGYYILPTHCMTLAIDIDYGSSAPGTNAQLYSLFRNGCQRFLISKVAPVYGVTYDANGGTGAPDSQTKAHDAALTLSTTIPTRAGYTFQGWATTSTATTASYKAGGSYTNNAGVTLYAVWSHNGDVNGDGTPTAYDLVVLMNYLSGADSAPKYPDVNSDGVHDLLDLVRLMKLMAA